MFLAFWHFDILTFEHFLVPTNGFGDPAGRPAEFQNGGQNRPFLKDGGIFLKDVTDISPTRLRGRLRSAPEHHFFGFIMDFDPLFKDLLIFNNILSINLGHRFARRPKQTCCFIAKFYKKSKDLITKWIHLCFQ